MKSKFAEEGGDPKDMDKLMDAFFDGDLDSALKEFERKYPDTAPRQRAGCMLIVVITLIITGLGLGLA